MKEFKLTTVDNQILNVVLWDDVIKTPKAVVQLIHGSAEHIYRYDQFAQFLNKQGIIMIGDDHRGHGKTAGDNNQPLGYFSWTDGWNKIVNDEKSVNSYAEKNYPNLPIIMIGHSMGSFMARDYAIKYSHTIDGLILSGTTEHDGLLLTMSQIMAKIIRIFNGPKKPSKFIWKLAYEPLNKRFKAKHSKGVEWLSRDVRIQEEYLQDPLCGQVFSNSAFFDLFKGLKFIRQKKYIKLMRKNLPIMIVSGQDDPVAGKKLIGPKKVFNKFKNLDYNVALKFYPEFRHEILNEFGKEEVEKDFLTFINQILKANRS